MNLSKYSPSFGGYSVAQIWASQFEFDDTPNQGTTKTSWCQHSDCALVACYFCVKKRWKKAFYGSSETALAIFRKQIVS